MTLPSLPRVVITGFSGSGKTTFLEKFIPGLRGAGYTPGYLKHAGGKYDLDVPGKDSFRQKAAGASFACVFTDRQSALHQEGPLDETLLHCHPGTDLLLMEGFKTSPHPKIVCIHPSKGVPDHLHWDRLSSAEEAPTVWAYLTSDVEEAAQINQQLGRTLAFCRDDVPGIQQTVLHHFESHCRKSAGLNAAVMIGGKSSRMGEDKAWLDYGSGPQALHLFELLSSISGVQKTFFSGAPKTIPPIAMNAEQVMVDRFLDFGPLGGLLTLFENCPQNAWLVVACDLVNLQKETIDYLMEQRNPLKAGTLFVNNQQRFEPLVAIYEPHMGLHLKRSLFDKGYSLQRILKKLPVKTVPIPQHLEFQFLNVNTPQERATLLNKANQE